jgi:ABC-2 type transport system permease protein
MKRYLTLLKREYWEYRALAWLPIAMFISMVAVLAPILTLAVCINLNACQDGSIFSFFYTHFINDLGDPDYVKRGASIDNALFLIWRIVACFIGVLTIGYLIESLYTDRKDRSILFWKSLPVSDTETVLTKVVTAAGVMPCFAFTLALVLGMFFLSLLSFLVWIKGGEPMTQVWGPAEPMAVFGKLLLTIPINFVWALPGVGMLLMSSSYARSKTTRTIPIAALALIGVILTYLQIPNLPSALYWRHIFDRLAFGLIPEYWGLLMDQSTTSRNLFGPSLSLENLSHFSKQILISTETWIGAVVGAAFIAAAIYFRRRGELTAD